MELIQKTLGQLVAIEKNGCYKELATRVSADAVFANSVLRLLKLINQNTEGFSKDYLDSLSSEEIVALIKVLTIIDNNAKNLIFGSISSIKSLVNELEQRNFIGYEETIDWVFKNSTSEYIPFFRSCDVKSLKAYSLNQEARAINIKRLEVDAELKRIEKQKWYYPKATEDLKDAIKRKDIKAFDTLIRKGAEIYVRDDDGRTLVEKIEEIKVDQRECNPTLDYQFELDDGLWLKKGTSDKQLLILVSDTHPSPTEYNKFDCVCLTARYDHGFGFSQLYRFVDNKESQAIKDCCDVARQENRAMLLPKDVSNKWNVIVTPIVKGNSINEKDLCKEIMKEILDLSQLNGIISKKLLISQFGYFFSYKEQQFNGIFEAIKEMQEASFGKLDLIYFEVDTRYRKRFYNQLRKFFIS